MAVSKPLAGQLVNRASYASHGLIAAWLLNEGGGVRASDSIGQKHGTLTNFSQTSTSGWVGSGVQFDGSNDFIDLGLPVLVNGRSAYSITLRIIPKSIGAVQVLYSEATTAGVVNGVYLATTGGLNGYVYNGSDNICASTTTAIAGGTYDVTFTVDKASHTMKVYVNGRLETTVTSWSGTYSSSIATVALGCAKSGTQHFNGRIVHCYVHNKVLDASLVGSLHADPYQLWDEPQIVFAPVTTFTGTATSSQAQTAAATGLAGNIGTSTSLQAQTAAATGLSGYIGTATASQAQTANATGLAGVIGTATSSQAQSATGAGAEAFNGNATSSQAQTSAAVGLAGVIGTATASQAQTSDAIGVAGIVGTATSSQAQTVNGAGNNGQLSVQFGGHIAQPQYIHVAMFARGTGKATCKSRPHVRVLTRALAIGRSKGTCRPLARQYMAGRAVGASVPVISSMRLQYNETWHAQRARDDQSLLFGF